MTGTSLIVIAIFVVLCLLIVILYAAIGMYRKIGNLEDDLKRYRYYSIEIEEALERIDDTILEHDSLAEEIKGIVEELKENCGL